MYQDIEIKIENKVGQLILNRPEKLNAIRLQTYKEIISALKDLEANDGVNVILLKGSGGKFCAGNDLNDFVSPEKDQVTDLVGDTFVQVHRTAKPIVAAVSGVAVGIGTTILLHCDYVVCSEKTKFRLPFVQLGVLPEGGSSKLLAEAIGPKRANELLLSGRFFNQDESYEWGLVNEKAAVEDFERLAMDKALELAQLPQHGLKASKQLIKSHRGDVEKLVRDELEDFKKILNSSETQTLINSLLGK